MDLSITTSAVEELSADWLLIPVFEGVDASAIPVAGATQDAIGCAIKSGDLSGKNGELTTLYVSAPVGVSRVMTVGLGEPDQLSVSGVREAFGAAAKQISSKENQSVAVLPPAPNALKMDAFSRNLCDGMAVGCVGQDVYRTERKMFDIAELQLVGDAFNTTARAAREGKAIGESVNITRDLVNRMPQEIDPVGFAKRAEELCSELGLKCRVFDEKELESERMNAMLAVSRGSSNPPRMVVVEYNGGENDGKEIALVGKGVTFDSGGLSLKPNEGMKTMKCDMAGAATVMGAMAAAARLKLPVNLIGYMGLVENMVGAGAYKLGDVLTARNGVTIEVLNTDAEGRLVLADVLSYAVDRGADQIIDLATLTGAVVVALGEDLTGAFTNNQEWCDKVLAAAGETEEGIWQLPMFDLFAKLLDGDVSDIKNVGPRWGGAITAAKFLERFVGGTPWVHLDIAGPSFASSAKSHIDAGASGCMVRTLLKVAQNFAD
jgi:leucyl aminopeptidase